MPETTCAVVKIPVPSQAKLHKQWCLFDQACFQYFRIVLLSWRKTVNLNKLLSAKATSTLTERFARSQALWRRRSRRSMMRRFMYCIQYIHSFFIFYICIFIYWIEEVNDKKREDDEEEQQQRCVFIVMISKYCEYPQMFQRRAGRGRAQSFDEAAFISQLTLLDVQVQFWYHLVLETFKTLLDVQVQS